MGKVAWQGREEKDRTEDENMELTLVCLGEEKDRTEMEGTKGKVFRLLKSKDGNLWVR